MRVHGKIMVAVLVLAGLVCQPADAQDENGGIDRPVVLNEMLLTGIGDPGNITIFEFRDGSYQEAWSTTPSGVVRVGSGGEAGDLTGDGVAEFVLVRWHNDGSGWDRRLEIWAFDAASQGWYLLCVKAHMEGTVYIGDILDFDNDGVNEILITDKEAGLLNLYSYNGSTIEVEATVRDCGAGNAYFHATGGDLDDDGTPEILFQCYYPEDLYIHEYDQDSDTYPIIGEIILPDSQTLTTPSKMIVDDMETGDVNGDGIVDAVFCGNSGQAHVVTFSPIAEIYEVEFQSPPPQGIHAFSQTCSVGDVTNDGQEDILVVNSEGAKVYSHDGSAYQEIWVGDYPEENPLIAVSFVGDADNDGFTEFLFGDVNSGSPGEYRLYENDVVAADTFFNTISFATIDNYMGTILIGNLNPMNDVSVFSDTFETGDTSAWSATVP